MKLKKCILPKKVYIPSQFQTFDMMLIAKSLKAKSKKCYFTIPT